jgi:hypothetical protein
LRLFNRQTHHRHVVGIEGCVVHRFKDYTGRR